MLDPQAVSTSKTEQVSKWLKAHGSRKTKVGSLSHTLGPCALNLAPESKSSLFTRLQRKYVEYTNLRYKILVRARLCPPPSAYFAEVATKAERDECWEGGEKDG